MTVNLQVVESPAGHLHLLLDREPVCACGRKGGGWQLVAGRRLRAAPFCQLCLRAVQRKVRSARAL